MAHPAYLERKRLFGVPKQYIDDENQALVTSFFGVGGLSQGSKLTISKVWARFTIWNARKGSGGWIFSQKMAFCSLGPGLPER